MPLTPDKVFNINFAKGIDLTIKQKIIPDSACSSKDIADWCKKGQKMKPCRPLASDGRARGIVIHNTPSIKVSGTTQAEQYTRATWPNCNMGGVVVHFYASPEEVWQNLLLTEQGWHATDGSSRTVAHKGASYSTLGGNIDCVAIEIPGPESEETGAKLAAYLLYTLGLKIEDVYTHNYFISYAKYGTAPSDNYIKNSYKNCPIYILDHWQSFLDKVEGYYAMLISKNTPANDPPADNKTQAPKVLYKTQIGAFSVLDNAKDYLKKAKAAGFDGSYITKQEVKGQTLYRVQIGAFSTYAAAERFGLEAKKQGFEYIVKKA